MTRPPGPDWPIALQTWLAVFHTERFTDFCRDRYGPVVRLRVLGLGDFVSVASPDGIRDIFAADPAQARAGEANAALGIAENSVIVADGSRHLRLRRLLLPPFHGEAIAGYEADIAAIARTSIGSWPRGEPIRALPLMQAVTLEIILRVVVGVQEGERRDALRRLLPRVLGTGILTLRAEQAIPSPLRARARWVRARDRVKALLLEEILARRRSGRGSDDVLGLLLAAQDPEGDALTDLELRDQLLTLLLAGHETSAATLAWCLERVSRHPHVQRRMADGDTGYLDAVLQETLRVRPVVDQVVRRLAAPAELAGHELPAGTLVAASIIGVQRSGLYPDPLAFRPERFLEAAPPSYGFIPFGGGTRRCLGASFALLEMRTVLQAFVSQVRLRPTTARGERPVRWRRFTTVPAGGGRVVLDPATSSD